jgi:hypothetical protein
MSIRHVDLLGRTAVYVIRMYGGVGGEVSRGTYPDSPKAKGPRKD